MFRSNFLALALAGLVAATSPAVADPVGFSFRVANRAAPSPVLQGAMNFDGGRYYGSLSARTEPSPDRLASGRLRVGFRPHVGRTAFDVGYSRAGDVCCGAFDAGVSRPLGRGRMGMKLSVEADSGVSRASTQANLPVSARVTLEGRIDGRYSPATDAESLGVEIGVVNALSRSARFNLRLREASDAPGRAEVAFGVSF